MISLKFGDGRIEFPIDTPPAVLLRAAGPLSPASAGDPSRGETEIPLRASADVTAALDAPTDGSAPLAERVRPGHPVTIVVSDVTRGWIPTAKMLASLVTALNRNGIPDRDITILTATGSHRPHTATELAALVGPDILSRVAVVDHRCEGPDLVDVGSTSRGTPVALDRLVTGERQVILTGGVAFHLMCGFGGGRKSLCPGVAGYGTIQANHRLVLSREPGNLPGPGRLEGNAMHADLMEIARMANPAFLINMVPAAGDGPHRFVSGDWRTAWEQGCRLLARDCQAPIESPADLVVASCGGYPYDLNLYQTTKTADHAVIAAKPGGALIVVSECREGLGTDEFGEVLGLGLAAAEERLHRDFTVPAFAAYRLLQIASEVRLILISRLPEDQVRSYGFIPATSPEEALREAQAGLPRSASTYVLPLAAGTLPTTPRWAPGSP